MHSIESLVYNKTFYIVYHYNHYILGLSFLSSILSVLPLNCFTTVGASHYYTYIYASYMYVMY